jgi:hypothetical protein
MSLHTNFLCLIFLSGFSVCLGQPKPAKNNLRVVNRELDFKDGVNSPLITHLNSAPGAGIAWITEQNFEHGTIEFDEKGKDAFQQSFVGIAFHGENDSVYESVYFRPFNFKSSDSARKLHAVQYIVSPNYDWPKLRADFPNQYEKPVMPAPDPNEWFHVKIDVTENKISVFVNNNSAAAIEVTPIVHLNGKMIGYWVGNGSEGEWKNFVIRQ